MTFEEAQARLADAKADGDFLGAIDYARAAADAAPDDDARDKMRVEEIVQLARIASTDEAYEKYRDYGLGHSNSPDARSLRARLDKDRAFESDGAEKAAFLRQSLDGYRAVLAEQEPGWDRARYEFNGVNVVTLAHLLSDLTGDASHIEVVADVRDRLLAFEPLNDYWSLATRAEVELVTGRDADAVETLKKAVALKDVSRDVIVSTLTQLRRINPNSAAVKLLRGGPVMHYSGHMISAPDADQGRFLAPHEDAVRDLIADNIRQIDPAAVYGSLASGVDILVLEVVRDINRTRPQPIETRIFLPFDETKFYRRSIKPSGGDWGDRARALIKDARISLLTREQGLSDDALAFGLSGRHAMGTAVLDAERAGKDAVQLVAWDGRDHGGLAGAAADRRHWRGTGREQVEIDLSPFSGAFAPAKPPSATPVRREAVALVFGDVKNFSKLKEHQLPAFVAEVLGAIKNALAAADSPKGALRLSNTWGDGVFAVFDTAAAAARFALDLQARMQALDLPALGLPTELAIRLGMHFGAVFQVHEPVTGRDNYFGEAVARAARIEPITREGRIFVSEEFASELALDPASPAEAEYVGERDAAKNYGRFRLYRIRPKRGAGEA